MKVVDYEKTVKLLRRIQTMLPCVQDGRLVNPAKKLTANNVDQIIEKLGGCAFEVGEIGSAEPLTVNELRELLERCEPVYVARKDGGPMFRGQKYCAAVLDRKITFGGIYDQNIFAIYGDKLTLWEGDYGLTWLAYRNRPEEAE